ncbi:hypothetical protein BV25DRAFT_1837366 [Artomyces pyxidatus]|uniref:Uncharacterized protein n=1 Tax=Artomyces pyxidatus TaxID=48021 RepID=A0ACB8T6C4_9AGAM|nr:hypothetical protein BV25DRAFT_1837366 [Artomyces pyxidatus]
MKGQQNAAAFRSKLRGHMPAMLNEGHPEDSRQEFGAHCRLLRKVRALRSQGRTGPVRAGRVLASMGDEQRVPARVEGVSKAWHARSRISNKSPAADARHCRFWIRGLDAANQRSTTQLTQGCHRREKQAHEQYSTACTGTEAARSLIHTGTMFTPGFHMDLQAIVVDIATCRSRREEGGASGPDSEIEDTHGYGVYGAGKLVDLFEKADTEGYLDGRGVQEAKRHAVGPPRYLAGRISWIYMKYSAVENEDQHDLGSHIDRDFQAKARQSEEREGGHERWDKRSPKWTLLLDSE